MLSSAPAAVYRRWRRWLPIIYDRLVTMRYRQQMWAGYVDIVRANPLIQTPGLFHDWLARCYADAQQVAIRQQAEGKDSRVISLGKLLKDMEANSEALTRRRYRLGFALDDRAKADGWFDTFAGAGAVHLDPQVPKRDFDGMTAKVNRVNRYVNKRIAHWDRVGPGASPTFPDMNECIDHLYGLLQKYHPFIAGSALAGEVSLPAWQAIFYRPWIVDTPPAKPQEAIGEAIRLTAKLEPNSKRLLLQLLLAYNRVPASVAIGLLQSGGDRRLAELLLQLDGNDVVRAATIDLLRLLGPPG